MNFNLPPKLPVAVIGQGLWVLQRRRIWPSAACRLWFLKQARGLPLQCANGAM